ncbi:MAG: TIGR03809 family protein [Alphaproteobacteria bacterium]|nr:MAG: TIGR03809 family protein [Alphaproteobacteria bacterium]
MTHRIDVTCGHLLAARWHTLAEQRLEHLTELFESGRWRRYYSERAFLENIQEAKTAVRTWRNLARGPAETDRAIEVPKSSHMPATFETARAAGTEFVPSDEARSALLVDLRALEQALNEPGKPAFDIAAIEQRYPALRHAL